MRRAVLGALLFAAAHAGAQAQPFPDRPVRLLVTSPPDGYTLLAGTNSTFSVNPTLFPQVPYDTLRDFAMVSITVTTGYRNSIPLY